MQKQGTTWHCLAALGMLASCSLSIFAGGGADKKDAPEPLQPETVKVWRDAGAQSGKQGWVPVFVCDGADFPEGNRRLQKKGAVAFPFPFPDPPREVPDWLAKNAGVPPRPGELFS